MTALQPDTDAKVPPAVSRRFGLLLLMLAVAVAIVLYQTRPAMISPLGAVLALMTCAIGILPTLAYVLSRERTIPFFPAVGLFQVFCFGLSPFLLHLAWPDAPPISYWGGKLFLTAESIETMVLVLAGTAALVAGFFLVRCHGLRWLPVPRIHERAGPNASLLLLAGLTLAHLAYKFIPGLSQVPSIGQFLDPAGYVAFSVFLVLVLRRKTSGLSSVFAVVALALLAAVRVETFNFTQLMILSLCVVAALVYVRAHRTASILGLLLVLSLPVYEFTATVRYLDGGFANKAGAFFSIIDNYRKGVRRDGIEKTGGTSATETATRRISHTWLLAHVVEKSPAVVPFWGGETYKPLFTAMIPRALWPGKPLEITGGIFGKRYGLIPPESRTSLNLPWHVELYANFGNVGVLIGMALIGAFLAVLDKLLNAPGRRDLEMGIGLGVLIPLTFMDSNFSLMVGTLPQFVLCLYAYLLVGEFVLRRLGMGSTPAPAN